MASWTPAMKRNRRSLQTSPISRRKLRSRISSWSLRVAQVVEQLVHHQEQAVVGILLVEGSHHLFEGALVVGHLVRGREGIRHAHGGQVLLQFGHEDVAQGHGSRADFGSDHLEAAADLARGTRHALVVQMDREIAIFGKGGDHGHEVRLTGAVVADDQQPLVIHGLVELKLRNDQVDQLLGHLLGDDVGLDKLLGQQRPRRRPATEPRTR